MGDLREACAQQGNVVDPYWVIASIVAGVGALMTHTARTAWLNQEFG